MKAVLVFLVVVVAFQFQYNDSLAGRWESKPSEKGNVTGVVFKNDSLFEGYVNRKPFTSGVYRYNTYDSVLSFVDNGCNGVQAVYKVLLFSNSDSLRFKAITDSCIERKEGMHRLILGRVKPK